MESGVLQLERRAFGERRGRGRREETLDGGRDERGGANISESLDYVGEDERAKMSPRQTKIVCAIGPACRDVETLVQMLDAGMNVARLNFSHGNLQYHQESVRLLRQAMLARVGSRCSVLMDTKGPEIRTGTLSGGVPVQLLAQQLLLISTNTSLEDGTNSHITCTYRGLADATHPGATILCSDGTLSFRVLFCSTNGGQTIPTSHRVGLNPLNPLNPPLPFLSETEEKRWTSAPYVIVCVLNDGILGERKNVCLPSVNISSESLPSLTDKDREDLRRFAYQQEVDVVSCSLVRCAQDVLDVRACLEEARVEYLSSVKGSSSDGDSSSGNSKSCCKTIRVHAKIESIQALQHLDEILSVADGVHVSRGDLGMALPLHKVFLAQKMIITRARMCGKPVVTSTEMLDSMIDHLRPSHAECTDVANAVLDGTDAMMLSGETAKGQHPIKAIIMMARIARSAESCVGYHDEFLSMRQACTAAMPGGEVLAASAVDTSFKMEAKMIVVFTSSGRLPMHVAKYRPGVPIVALTPRGCLYSEGVANQLGSLSRGVHGWTYDAVSGELDGEDGEDVRDCEEENKEDDTNLDSRMIALRRAMSRSYFLGWIVRGDPVVSLWCREEDGLEMDGGDGGGGGEGEKESEVAVKYIQSVFFFSGR